MVGIEDGSHSPDWREQLPEDREADENFVKKTYPLDPMMIAFPLIETYNITIDPKLAFQLQEIYEEIGNRYLDIAALLHSYVEQERQKNVGDCRSDKSSDPPSVKDQGMP